MIQFIQNKNHKFVVKWRLTTWCNYKCPYCFNTFLEEKDKHITSEKIMIERAKKVNTLIDNYVHEKTSLQMLGGEIMWYDMSKILKQFEGSKYIKNIQITSNFSAPLERYIKLDKKISLLSLSYHDSQVDFDTFFDKLDELCKSDISYNIKVEFVANKSNEHLVPKITERVKNTKKENIKLVIDNEHGLLDGLRYDECTNNNSSISHIVKEDNKLIHFGNKSDVIQNYGGLNLDGYYCSGSVRNIEIRDENIYDTKCEQEKLIGTLDTGFEKHTKLCRVKNCILCGNISVDRDYDHLINFLKLTRQKVKIKNKKKK